jgi:hypothetical protein
MIRDAAIASGVSSLDEDPPGPFVPDPPWEASTFSAAVMAVTSAGN